MEVKLYLYDLTQGMAAIMAPSLIGRPLEAIWHSSVVVYGTEYFFGQGIYTSVPGQTHHGSPRKILSMGFTSIPFEVFQDYLREISVKYGPYKYHLLDNNCNHFSADVIHFLTGREIPADVVNQTSQLINTPIGQMMRPMIEQMFGPSSIPAGVPFQGQPTATPSTQIQQQPHAPKLTPVLFRYKTPSVYPTGQIVTIIAKLKTLLEEERLTLTSDPASIDHLDKALKSAFNTKTLKLSDGTIQFLEELLEKFPAEKGFPLLDILRIIFAFDQSYIARYTADNGKGVNLWTMLEKYFLKFDLNKSKPTVVMALRLACNVFLSDECAKKVTSHHEHLNSLVAVAVKGLLSGDRQVRETASSLAFNLSLAQLKETPDPAIEVVSALHQALVEESDFEVAFRIVCALGHFLVAHDIVVELLVSLQLDVQLHLISQNDQATNPLKTTLESKEKLQEVAKEVLGLLQK